MNAFNASPVRGRFRRQVTSAMLVLSLSIGGIVATPTPAHAATSVYGCFRYEGQGSGTPPQGTPVYLVFWNGSNWQHTGFSLPMNQYGCVWMPTGIWAYSFVALYVNTGGTLYSFQGGGSFSGFSQIWVGPGTDANVNLGTGVLKYSCAGQVTVCR
jgi:hypothetical protein